MVFETSVNRKRKTRISNELRVADTRDIAIKKWYVILIGRKNKCGRTGEIRPVRESRWYLVQARIKAFLLRNFCKRALVGNQKLHGDAIFFEGLRGCVKNPHQRVKVTERNQ